MIVRGVGEEFVFFLAANLQVLPFVFFINLSSSIPDKIIRRGCKKTLEEGKQAITAKLQREGN